MSQVPPRASTDPLTGLQAARFRLYIHFPFCLSKCPYCDFASTVARRVPQARYTNAVLRELALRLEALPRLRTEPVESIFIGGGTPSLWEPQEVARVLDAVAGVLHVSRDAEVTLEANPGASDAARFGAYRAAGVNRISIGVQSFERETLAALGRAHDGDTAEAAFRSARAAGFANVSMDFIYGVHGQSLEGVVRDAHRAVSLGPEHLSAYALTLDRESLAEEVPLAKQLRRGEVMLPPDEAVVTMSRAVREVYASAGLGRYEISNYARPGFHSRHNALYWTGGEYLALGVGATGHWREREGGGRYSNHRSAERYLEAVEAGTLPEASREPLTRRDLFAERLSMGLRLEAGIDVVAVCAQFGESSEARQTRIDTFVQHGLGYFDGTQLRLTPMGTDLHSEISAQLI